MTLLEKHEKTFGVKKPIIGCLHMNALPGTPYATGDIIKENVKKLKEDAKILCGSGFDAVIFANEGDRPYLNTVGPEIVAAYTRIATEVMPEITVPVGCGIIADPIATIAVANALGCKFVRTYVSNTFNGVFGWQSLNSGEIFRFRKNIGAEDVNVYSWVEAHAGTCMDDTPVPERIKAQVAVLPISGVLLGGPAAGVSPKTSKIADYKQQVPNVPVILANGTTVENVKELMEIADGCIVGTNLKIDKYLYNPVDPKAAEAFIAASKA